MKDKEIFIRRRECEKFDNIIQSFPGPLFVFDTETTGVNAKKDYIIQLSAIRLDRDQFGNYKITSYLNQYIKPPFPVPPAASAVNGITDEFLLDKPTEADAFPYIRDYLKDAEEGRGIVIGYNIKRFDLLLMEILYNRYDSCFCPADVIDCMIVAKEIVRKADLADQRMTLGNVADLYGILEEGMHDALTDIFVTGRLLFRLYEDYLDNFKDPKLPKPRIRITGMYRFKRSKTVNYVMISGTVITENNQVITGKVRYDVWNSCYTQVEGDLFTYGDFDQFAEDADEYAGGNVANYKPAPKKTFSYS